MLGNQKRTKEAFRGSFFRGAYVKKVGRWVNRENPKISFLPIGNPKPVKVCLLAKHLPKLTELNCRVGSISTISRTEPGQTSLVAGGNVTADHGNAKGDHVS